MNTTDREQSLTFCGKDPGAAKFGNFINYYKFHSVYERMKHLHHSMFPVFEDPILILDIGCNTGELTIEIYRYLESLYPNTRLHFLAIDIDQILIERADKTNKDISFVTCNIMNESGQKIIIEYLEKFNKKLFDVIFCFSVTMWIHINNGDEKFIEFLNLLKTISKSIVIEPQPWKCYKNAQRRMKRAGANFELFNSLNITKDVEVFIEKVLSSDTHKKVYESPSSSWHRIIQSYHMKDKL